MSANCLYCQKEYDSSLQSELCPHPMLPFRQLTAGRSKIPKSLREPGKVRVVVLQEPFYEKQPYESAKALQMWTLYRELDPQERSYTAVATKLRKSITAVAKIAKKWKWAIRIEAYDLMKDRERLETDKKSREEMMKRHAEIAQGLQYGASAVIQEALDTIDAKRTNPNLPLPIGPSDAVRWAEAGIKLERLVKGESTEHTVIESSQMVAERRLRDAVHDIQLDIQEREITHPDELPENRALFVEARVKWGAEDYNVDLTALTQAILGHITTSQAEN